MDSAIMKCICGIIHTSSPRGWLGIDAEFRIIYINDSLCQRWGRPRKHILGQSLLSALYDGQKRDDNGNYWEPLIETMAIGRELRDVETLFPLTANDDNNWFLVNTLVVQGENGQPKYAFTNYLSIDKFKAVEHRLDKINMSIIKAFCTAVGACDAYTGQHAENVAALMTGLADYLRLTPAEKAQAYIVGIVHDVGKIGVPEHILNKPGRLSAEEFDIIKQHSSLGAGILAEIDGFDGIVGIVRYHHEQYGGGGYPENLTGEQIPYFSRMLAVCDAYDTMINVRCYRKHLSIPQALAEIARCAGSQFDPFISYSFIEYIKQRNANSTGLGITETA